MNWFKENIGGFTGLFGEAELLSKHTYYRIGGPARFLAVPKSREDLAWLSRGVRESGVKFFVLGSGSNLLVSDQGFDGLVIKMGRLDIGIEFAPSGLLRTGSGVAVSTLLRRCAQEGWAGLEFLTGIPGSVGGVVVMNAGTHLGETGQALQSVDVFLLSSGETRCFSRDELRFQYRKNLFLPEDSVVLSAEWSIHVEEPAVVKARIDETLARRKATQPVDYPSCGSVFKNPRAYGKSAWQVLDQLGLRGHRIGDAQISEKHSNFIVNLGSARASDVRALIELAKARAAAELGIPLEEEVMYVGEF